LDGTRSSAAHEERTACPGSIARRTNTSFDLDQTKKDEHATYLMIFRRCSQAKSRLARGTHLCSKGAGRPDHDDPTLVHDPGRRLAGAAWDYGS